MKSEESNKRISQTHPSVLIATFQQICLKIDFKNFSSFNGSLNTFFKFALFIDGETTLKNMGCTPSTSTWCILGNANDGGYTEKIGTLSQGIVLIKKKFDFIPSLAPLTNKGVKKNPDNG